MGSKNGQGSNGKQGVGSKQLINGRKTSSSNQKLTNVGTTGGKAGDDSLSGCCSESISDRSQTNFPFDIRISGFSSLMNTVRKSTPKVQKLILDECDIILECRVCRNLFRSLPNFLTHKQSFCKNAFHPSANSGFSQFIQNSDSSYEFQYHVDESLLQTVPASLHTNSNGVSLDRDSSISNENVLTIEDEDSFTPNGCNVQTNSKNNKASRLHDILARFAPEIENATRTPSSLYSNIIMKRDMQLESSRTQYQPEQLCPNVSSEKTVRLQIEPIEKSPPASCVVFQKAIGFDPSSCDVSDAQIDCRKVAHPDSAVLGPDGKIICVGNSEVVEKIVSKVIAQVEELQDEQQRLQTELNCPECFTLFPTRKTLRMHVRAAHRSGPEHDDEQVTSDNKMSSDLKTEPCDEASTMQESEIKISSPPIKKCKSDSPVEHQCYKDGSVPSQTLPLLPSKSNGQSGNVSTLPPGSTSSKSSSVDVRTLFLPSPKRPRGRPRKNSVISKKDTIHSKELPVRRDSRSCSSDASDSLSASRVCSPFSNVSAVQLSHDRRNSSSSSFTCGKCSAKFGTKSEMSMHLAHCAGVINYAFLRRPKSPENSKISIQIRRDYLKPSISNKVQENASSERSETISHNCTSNNLTSSSDFGWTRWNQDPADSNAKHNSGVSSKPLTLEECIEIAKYKFYSTSPSCSNARSAFSNLSSNHFKFQVNTDLCDNDEPDGIEDEEEENDDGSTTGDIISGESSEDDGLPDDDEKHSNHEVEIDAETDRDSNITDSGVSTTSIIRNKCTNSLAVELELLLWRICCNCFFQLRCRQPSSEKEAAFKNATPSIQHFTLKLDWQLLPHRRYIRGSNKTTLLRL
ncbi:unnamed protein product [Allacma fusca]|uniref:C2H2-type domain-containing protein n=1 Tax=Allacma fusca TaxID=39272 RepID=A0A8J2LRI3_9HEXA|nr:unnamed protein product [Allacma fusca]